MAWGAFLARAKYLSHRVWCCAWVKLKFRYLDEKRDKKRPCPDFHTAHPAESTPHKKPHLGLHVSRAAFQDDPCQDMPFRVSLVDPLVGVPAPQGRFRRMAWYPSHWTLTLQDQGNGTSVTILILTLKQVTLLYSVTS